MSKYSLLQYLKNPKSWTELGRQGNARGPFRIFQHPLLQNIEKLKGDPMVKTKFEKSLTMPKTLEGGPFSPSGIVCYAKKKQKTFFIQFARPNDSIWDHKFL